VTSKGVTRDELRKFLVRDDFATDNQTGFYVAPREISDYDFSLGHPSYRSIAYDTAHASLVYPKDCRLTDSLGFRKEGNVYRDLPDAQIHSITQFSRAGDVPTTFCGADNLPSAMQRREYENKSWATGATVNMTRLMICWALSRTFTTG